MAPMFTDIQLCLRILPKLYLKMSYVVTYVDLKLFSNKCLFLKSRTHSFPIDTKQTSKLVYPKPKIEPTISDCFRWLTIFKK